MELSRNTKIKAEYHKDGKSVLTAIFTTHGRYYKFNFSKSNLIPLVRYGNSRINHAVLFSFSILSGMVLNEKGMSRGFMRLSFMLFVYIAFLCACGDDTPPPPKPTQPNTHGVVLLFEEDMRNFSNITTCLFQDEADRWLGRNYPTGKVVEERWASSNYFTVTVETETFKTVVYFNGTIVDTPMECE